MNNEEKILQLLEAQQEELGIFKDRLEKLEEHAEVTWAGVNSLLDWAEECGIVIKFALP